MSRLLGVCGLVAALALVGTGHAGDKKEQKGNRKSGPDLEALFKKLDADGDGKISMEEFKKLPELYRPERPGGFGGFGGLDPDQLKKMLEKFGGGGGFDPEQIKKLLERFKGKKGKGGFDPERLKKLLEKFGGAGEFNLEQLQQLLEQFQGRRDPDEKKPARRNDL
ncbi:MAG: EF-hand domain-containing protein [Gemmataceae bacterium]|nr:EF-hand domain-containing protein [Gemmataceae bacterium]